MAMIEVEFPRRLAIMAVGGPGYSTQVNPGFSGYEQRQQNWTQARAQYNVSFENKPIADWEGMEAMFHAARGMANSFRLFDPGDYSMAASPIGVGDSGTVHFQLYKTYLFTASAYEATRPIQKPITSLVQDFQGNYLTDTVEVYLNGAKKAHSAGYHTMSGYDYTLDETTGVITFAAPPGTGVQVTADAQYHIPVRFNLDQMQKQFVTGINVTYAGGVLVTVSGITLVEVRIPIGSAS